MNSSMYYKKTKRDKIDRCNICLKSSALSWDHVPPKGCSNFGNTIINSFFDIYTGSNSHSTLLSQNGLKYRTICSDCNSFIGAKYDEDLIDLTTNIVRFVNSDLIIPPNIKLMVKPLRIIKSITGHMLAAKKHLGDTRCDDIYRHFILDENTLIPQDFHLFYWVYPFENTIIMRDFAMPAKRDGKLRGAGFFQLVKFFPIAFLFSNLTEYEGLPSLTKLASGVSIDDEIEMPIAFNRIVDRYWPERVENNNIILASEETSNAVIAETKIARR